MPEKNSQREETIGELHDRLPIGQEVFLPEYGVNVTAFGSLRDDQSAEAGDRQRPEVSE